METIHHLLYGMEIAFTLNNLMYCFIGAVLGTMVGILPGIGPTTAIAMLLPLTLQLHPLSSLIMLAGIYYGANHAGSTTSIMLNMPGEASAIVICLDGHPMARQGRAGPALCMAALASFAAGCASILIVAVFSPVLTEAALAFQSPEYTSIVILALVGTSMLSGKSVINNLSMAALGLLIGTVGLDASTGEPRFTAGILQLADGVDLIVVTMALFAFVDICLTLGTSDVPLKVRTKTTLRDLVPTWADVKASAAPVLRGTPLGAALGILPGTGPMISSFGAYAVEMKVAKDPSRFGKGAIEGVAAPEAAANAAAFTHFAPMLALGIPAGAPMALLLGAMLIQGISPGPEVINKYPDLFWGLIASMWIGNLMLLVLNLPLVGVWLKMLETPYRFIYPLIVVCCLIGVYSERQEAFDIYACAIAIVVGYVLIRLDCSPTPLVIGLLLGPMLEENFRRAMVVSRGDPLVFVERPISLVVLLITAGLVAASMYSASKKVLTRPPEALP